MTNICPVMSIFVIERRYSCSETIPASSVAEEENPSLVGQGRKEDFMWFTGLNSAEEWHCDGWETCAHVILRKSLLVQTVEIDGRISDQPIQLLGQ